MEKTYRMTQAAAFESLGVMRKFIEDACRAARISEEISFDLQLCMDEACTNIIEHGYAGMNPGSIIFEMEIAPHEVSMFITDFGRAFEPRPTPQPDLSDVMNDEPVRGFGLFFIYSLMDSVDYVTDELGNTLTLKKKLG